jgi:hypothetical protein
MGLRCLCSVQQIDDYDYGAPGVCPTWYSVSMETVVAMAFFFPTRFSPVMLPDHGKSIRKIMSRFVSDFLNLCTGSKFLHIRHLKLKHAVPTNFSIKNHVKLN